MMYFSPFYNPYIQKTHKEKLISNCMDNKINKEYNYDLDKKENKKNKQADSNFLGFSLAFDDLLILAILFFLYKEKNEDPYLYIALILLLLN